MGSIADQLEAFLADMARRRRLRPNTIRAYRSDLQLAASALPGPLESLTLDALETWLADARCAASTRNRRAASLSRFFTWAQRAGLCAANPILLRETTPLPRRLPNPIRSAAHREQLDRAIRHSPPPYRLIFTLLRETGMRASEVLGLTFADLCLDSGCEGLRLRDTKNGVDRVVILEPTATPRSLRGLRAAVRAHGTHPAHVGISGGFRDKRTPGLKSINYWLN